MEQNIEEYLEKNGIYAEDFVSCKVENKDIVSIEIEGDWKHEHLRLTYLMSQVGYGELCEDVTEEDGSDYYRSVHYYVKNK